MLSKQLPDMERASIGLLCSGILWRFVVDITLNYEERGEGEVLILLHGNGEDHTNFSFQIEDFSVYFRTLAIDTRGHGLSARGDRPFTLEQFADDLYDFMVGKGIESAILLGFSDGANIALIFALKHPDMVTKLILNGGNLFPRGCKKSVLDWIENQYEKAVEGNDEKTKELMALMKDEPHIAPSELEVLKMPVLVIAGTNDMIKMSHTKLIAHSIPFSKLCFIDGDHFIAYKKSREFDKLVLDFLLGVE